MSRNNFRTVIDYFSRSRIFHCHLLFFLFFVSPFRELKAQPVTGIFTIDARKIAEAYLEFPSVFANIPKPPKNLPFFPGMPLPQNPPQDKQKKAEPPAKPEEVMKEMKKYMESLKAFENRMEKEIKEAVEAVAQKHQAQVVFNVSPQPNWELTVMSRIAGKPDSFPETTPPGAPPGMPFPGAQFGPPGFSGGPGESWFSRTIVFGNDLTEEVIKSMAAEKSNKK